jgi:hypothetical protein
MTRLSALAVCFLLTIFACQAQVTGKWYGIAMPVNNVNSNGYLCEFLLKQTGNRVTGTFNYYFRNGYLTNKITGTFDPKTRKLRTREVPIIYHGTKDVGIGIDCIMQGEFSLVASKVETSLTGYFVADENHSLTCIPLKIKFIKQVKEDTKLEEFKEEPETPKPLVTPKPIEKTPEQALEDKKKAELKTRVNEVVNELIVSDDSVSIQFYDNGIVDKDSISVFYNNKLVVYKKMLSDRTPISVKVNVDSNALNNELIMFAENLGDTPPNSALMIISDSKHKYEIFLSSNYQKNATIRLRREGTPRPDAVE